jgi:hypothetical protein
MSRLLAAGYVSQVGDLIWLTYKGIQLLAFMEDEEGIQLPSIRPAMKCVSVFVNSVFTAYSYVPLSLLVILLGIFNLILNDLGLRV